MDEALSGGWAAHVARWRGWQAPPRRVQAETDATAATPRGVLPLAGQERQGETGPGVVGLTLPLPALLSTARALPPLDWAPLQALALGDARRRQALAAQAEEEDALLVLLLLEEGL